MSLVHGIFVSILLQLLNNSLIEINTEHRGEANQIKGYIGQFFTYSGGGVWIVCNRFGGVFTQPLENFSKFTDFASQRHHQVFGRMKLMPVSF